MGAVEQTPEFLVGLQLGFLMGCRLDHVLEVVVVDQGRELRHCGIHLLLGVQIHAIRVVAVLVFMHHGTLRQVGGHEFGEALEIVFVTATNVENRWPFRVEMRAFFDDRIEADFGKNPHAEILPLPVYVKSLSSQTLSRSAAILSDMSTPVFYSHKRPIFHVASTRFCIAFFGE